MKQINKLYSSARSWVLQDKHKEKMGGVKAKVGQAFTEHPHQAGETYLVHMFFTTKMALKFFYIGFAIFVHGIFPFTFVTTGSREMEKVSHVMKARKPKVDETSSGGSI
jgi:hypothetical protein